MSEKTHILITGGAGYIGSLLTGELLRTGKRVTVVDSLLFGGESLLGYMAHPDFHFVRGDVTEAGALQGAVHSHWQQPEAVIHLAAIVGFPACQALGRAASWKYNVEAVQRTFEQAIGFGAGKFIFSSTYSNYGLSTDGQPVTESSPLNPQSLYAETKIAAEQFLLDAKDAPAAPLIFRFATLYGISPRTRFDLIINQFVLEAFTRRELVIYQRGYSRSFVHVRDVVRGILMGLDAPQESTRGEIYNLGTDEGNFTKDEIVALIKKYLPETSVIHKDLTFGGDMRDITVSFEKIRRRLGFKTTLTVEDGIRELLDCLRDGIIRNPHEEHYRNAQFIVH